MLTSVVTHKLKDTQKYDLLSKIVKSFLALHNGNNANAKRSLFEHKITLTSERTKLSAETLTGLRTVKDHARSCAGEHNINTLSKKAWCIWVFKVLTKL